MKRALSKVGQYNVIMASVNRCLQQVNMNRFYANFVLMSGVSVNEVKMKSLDFLAAVRRSMIWFIDNPPPRINYR